MNVDKKAFENIANEFSISAFILFGSFANNTNTLNSDIDIAYIAQKKLDSTKKRALYSKISTILNDTPLDLIELNTQDSILLRYEIFENGKIIYEKEEGLVDDLAGDAWIEYQNNKKYYEEYSLIISKSIESI